MKSPARANTTRRWPTAKLGTPAKQPEAGATGLKGAWLGIITIVVLVVSKLKFLLLGFTKLGTVLSMLAFLGVYWDLYGWMFALGLVLSIYIHEMGHVASLRHYGIPASAPMFIPGLGAVVRLKAHPPTKGQDARVGLAGPIWGAGAAIASYLLFKATGKPIFAGITHTGAVINLSTSFPSGSSMVAVGSSRSRGRSASSWPCSGSASSPTPMSSSSWPWPSGSASGPVSGGREGVIGERRCSSPACWWCWARWHWCEGGRAGRAG